MADVVVLGAGPSGLLAALESAESGHRVTVLEAASQVGGLAGSFDVAGQRVDFGSHRLHPATAPHMMRRIQSLLGDDLQARERNGRIRLRDRWIGFPLRTVDTVRSLPLDFSFGVARDMVTGPLRRAGDDTFAGAIIQRLGPTIFNDFYAPYSAKLYGVPAHELDTELADRRVAATSPGQILQRVLRATRSDGRRFWYPRNGYGQIAERLAATAAEAGVDIRLESSVESIATAGEHGPVVGISTGSSGGRTESVDGDVILSTIPLSTLARVIDPTPRTDVCDALSMLRTRAMVLVYLVIDQSQYTPFDAHYFPEPAVTMARLSEPKNYRDGDDPANSTVLCAELPCWADDPTWASSTDQLRDLVIADLEAVGLAAPRVLHAEVRRIRHVYPVFETATAAARETVRSWAGDLDRVASFGRQGQDVPDNLHHVLAMGSAAASAINPDGQIAANRWADSVAGFASHVVED